MLQFGVAIAKTRYTLRLPCTRYESEAEFRDVSGLSMMKTLTRSSLVIDVRMRYRNICAVTFTSHFALHPHLPRSLFGKLEFSIVHPLKQWFSLEKSHVSIWVMRYSYGKWSVRFLGGSSKNRAVNLSLGDCTQLPTAGVHIDTSHQCDFNLLPISDNGQREHDLQDLFVQSTMTVRD
jgi:hypothetical protein